MVHRSILRDKKDVAYQPLQNKELFGLSSMLECLYLYD